MALKDKIEYYDVRKIEDFGNIYAIKEDEIREAVLEFKVRHIYELTFILENIDYMSFGEIQQRITNVIKGYKEEFGEW